MVRILFYGLLFYLIYKFLKKLFDTNKKQKVHSRDEVNKENPSPYDKNDVEDIDYEDID